MKPSRSEEPEVELGRQLNRIVTQLRDVMDAERATLYLWDEAREELWSKVLLESGIGEIRLAKGEGIAGHVMASGESVRIDDVSKDARFQTRIDRSSGFVTRSMLCQPLINVEGERIGVVQVMNKRGGPFTDRDEALLEALDSQAVIAIENTQLVHALREAQDAEAKLLAERERQASELRIAQSIQNGLLPSSLPEDRRFAAHAMMEPAREVGGDLYDLFFLDHHRVAMVVGDVSGKGIPAAMFMAVTRTLLRALAFQIDDPAALAQELNRRLSEDNPSNMFVTLFYGIVDCRDGTLRYASGGHNAPFLARADGAVEELPRVKGIALGVFGEAPFEEGRARMAPSDHLLLFTDGLTEAMNAEEELFGDQRSLETFGRHAKTSPGAALDAIRQEVAAHVGGAEPSDDLTLLAFRYLGG